jgi:hypothetical protein
MMNFTLFVKTDKKWSDSKIFCTKKKVRILFLNVQVTSVCKKDNRVLGVAMHTLDACSVGGQTISSKQTDGNIATCRSPSLVSMYLHSLPSSLNLRVPAIFEGEFTQS